MVEKESKQKYNNEEICEVAEQFLRTKKESTARIYRIRLRMFREFYKKPVKV